MAIDDLLDEHEQSERVLSWLRANGAGLIGGIALGLAAIGGWKWWGNHQLEEHGKAAAQFQAATDAVDAKDKAAAAKVKALPDGMYRTLASLDLAKSQVETDQRDAAIATLQGIKTDDAAIAEIVNQRVARLLIDAKKPADAVKLLDKSTSPMAMEVRGDAQLALGKADLARNDYTAALGKLDEASPRRRLLELKLTEAGGTPVKPEAKS
ncbi:MULTISPECIES: tetratricopeptide repeat protein [unclassified Lysobacter]|uniref:YfgM family protein n=1 Tax=unclassified Lysobacter TaxID=2635362 RepID=UPI001BE56152|nr:MULTISPECIES: tetratricopeptide repeat protein [unclassified Lysobacter]MBT2746687.1 tetratricopeptide repeat protein [Lysobacter sp. ISL-42]MBT2751736.1 tetratricopeptide repeat protein [Lysobacter sp. ISL-50]MBT2778088.1 tetratricopeptide repeat protein [Lysobacter sp. ISL-54]MBT2781729.1 tetratricopeptide repeat protein [Lysobacter sp. ISL-52]